MSSVVGGRISRVVLSCCGVLSACGSQLLPDAPEASAPIVASAVDVQLPVPQPSAVPSATASVASTASAASAASAANATTSSAAAPTAERLVMLSSVDSYVGNAAPGKVAEDLSDLEGIDACVTKLQGGSAKPGELAFSVTIGPDGKITSVRLDRDTAGDPAFTACLEAALKQGTLPTSDSGTAVFTVNVVSERILRQRVIGVVGH